MKAPLPADVRKAAVDALYEARNNGEVMDAAAEAVARAVLAVIARRENQRPGAMADNDLTGRHG